MDSTLRQLLQEVEAQTEQLLEKYQPPYNSWHEAYGVIQEELDEFWDCVKTNNEAGMEEELIQVATTALIGAWQRRLNRMLGLPEKTASGVKK